MSGHVLLNLINQSGKRDEMRGLPSIFSLFCNGFNQFNNARVRMLDISFLSLNVIILSLCIDVIDVITFPENL